MVPSISLLSLLFCFLLSSVTSENWSHHAVMDAEGRYNLYWTPPEDMNGDSEITFQVAVETKGYVGLGLSPTGSMAGSDIVTGWVKDGEVYFQDRHGIGFFLPPLDDEQNYDLISGEENDTHTIFTFRRKLDTCDDQDMVIDESTMRVIYAFSEEDPEGNDPFYHGRNRGVRSIILLQTNVGSEPDFSSWLTWDIRSPDIDISDIDTLYWCKIFRSPNISEKHHIVYVKPILQEGHEQFIHHMQLYECVGGTPEEYEDYLDYRGHECFHPNMPILMQQCQGVIITWGVGGKDIAFPEHVGLPIYPDPVKYYMFEIHYDNPQLKEIIDHSGLRIYYTPELREYDAGNLALGAIYDPRVFIPPRQQSYTVVGHSNPECLSSALPETGIKALGILLHAHLTARQLTARHFRGNKELAPLASDKNYDFNYQDYRYFKEEVAILRGDQLTMECIYNTSQRSQVTLGGLSTREEMCLGFLMYYPLIDIYAALSAATFDCINNILETNSTNLQTLVTDLMSYDWENADISNVETGLIECEQETLCFLGNGTVDSVKSLISFPKDFEPYVMESTCSVNETCSDNETCNDNM